jgi:hypothetical protein
MYHKRIVRQHSIFLYSWLWHEIQQQHTQNALLCFHSKMLRERATILRNTYIAFLVKMNPRRMFGVWWVSKMSFEEIICDDVNHIYIPQELVQ